MLPPLLSLSKVIIFLSVSFLSDHHRGDLSPFCHLPSDYLATLGFLFIIIVSGKLTDNGGEQNVPSFTLCLHLLFLLIHVSVGAVENILHALIGLGIIGRIADGRGKLLPGV